MYSAVSGQIALSKQIDIIANNLANLSTTGFKAERLQFEKVLSQSQVLSGSPLKADLKLGNPLQTTEFAKVSGSFTDLTQGSIEKTNNDFDVAVNGTGFFVIATAEGERYTRAGNFRRETDGRLVTQDGARVQGQGGDIVLTGQTMSVSPDGTVLSDNKSVGKLRLVQIAKEDLEREKGLLFKLKSGGNVTEVVNGTFEGGALEGSNVNPVRELSNMILAQRLYESFQNVMQSNSKMNEQRNQHVGTLNS